MKHQKLLAISSLVLFGMLVNAVFAEVLFYDRIEGYGTGTYPALNPEITQTQNNGGSLTVASTVGNYTVETPDQLVRVTSGSHSNFSTFAYVESGGDSSRYGQILLTVGYTGPNTWMRFGLFGTEAPTYTALQNVEATQAVSLIWNPSSQLVYYSGLSYTTYTGWSTTGLHDITINYDLVAQTFNLYVDDTLIGSNLTISRELSSLSSIAMGGAYWTGDGTAGALDYWHWEVSDTEAFVGQGVHIPEPATITLVSGLGGLLCLIKKRRNI